MSTEKITRVGTKFDVLDPNAHLTPSKTLQSKDCRIMMVGKGLRVEGKLRTFLVPWDNIAYVLYEQEAKPRATGSSEGAASEEGEE